MLTKIYVHQNIHQSLIPLHLINKQQTREQSGFLHHVSQIISTQNIPTFYLFLFPITTIWNVFSYITQSSTTQENISLSLTQKIIYIFQLKLNGDFLGSSTARGISFAFRFSKRDLPERHTNPQKSEQGEKALQGANKEGSIGKLQEQLVSCVGEGCVFLSSKFMGLICDII